MNYTNINVDNKISSYDSCLPRMNLNLNVFNFMGRTSSNELSPKSILFSNRMKKYKDDYNILPIKLCLEDNVEWEIPAFIIINDSSLLGHKRLYSSLEKKLKFDAQDNIAYNMLTIHSLYSHSQSNSCNKHSLKREFSIVYEPCSVVINSETIKFNRLSYAKIADYCSLNYPKSVKRAYKNLLVLWTIHIKEYPEYWEGFDIQHMKKTYNNELNGKDDDSEDIE